MKTFFKIATRHVGHMRNVYKLKSSNVMDLYLHLKDLVIMFKTTT